MLIVIMLFLQNFRAMLVPATTVPVTIIGAFAAMALLGFTVNLMTLFALILAIGIVVDDAIVIVENTSRYIEQGLTPKEAAIKAMSELTGPVLGITLVLTAVFLPASFLPGITGQMFRQFALVIAATAIISAHQCADLEADAVRALSAAGGEGSAGRTGFTAASIASTSAVENRYIGIVQWMVRRPRSMVCVFFVIVGLAGAAFAIYPTALMPLEDQGYCIVRSRLPAGASQPRVRQVSADIDAILKDVPGIKGWVTIGGYSALDSAKLSNVVTAFVMYQDWEKRPPGFSQTKILADAAGEISVTSERAGCRAAAFADPGLGKRLRLPDGGRGSRRRRSRRTAENGAGNSSHRAQTGEGFLRIGFTTFSASSPQLYLDIDRTMAKSLGVTVNDVFQTLQTYLGSTYVNLFNKFNQSFQVRVQSDADYRRQLDDIGNLYVANQSGQMVPLGSLLDVRRVLGSELITRYNLYPAATITGSSHAEVQLRRGAEFHGADRREAPCLAAWITTGRDFPTRRS